MTHGAWLGTYEFEKSRMFAQECRGAGSVADIGANVGYYTLIAAKNALSGAALYAFEPLPRNIELFKKHVAMNRLDHVKLFPVALWHEQTSLRFSPGVTPSMAMADPTGDLTVEACTLDDMIDTRRLVPPDVMKIDVEGAEEKVLLGARRLLSEKRPTVFLATHSAVLRSACFDILRALDFRVDALEDPNELVARPR